MASIQILAPEVASQIAAGEVITRPAAVVKELVENALDAGARTITIDLEEGGCRRIRVADDGSGMSREEAPVSLLRHATSKIRAEADLLKITTLGFRGEALPSIAAVSRLTLNTRTAGSPAGYRLTTVAGEIQETGPTAAPPGTQVVVEDLFFNTPVRRKFLKSPQTEQAYIVEAVKHLALGYPEVHFLLRSQGKTLVAAPASQSLSDRVASLYGVELARQLTTLNFQAPGARIAGLISRADFTLASSRFQVLLVNRRVVRDRLLGAVLKAAYQGLTPKGRHPAGFVLLRLPPELVDVNVHPTKAEVRFQDSGRVYAWLLGAMRQSLGHASGEIPTDTLGWDTGAFTLVREPGTLPLDLAPAGPAEPGLELAPRPALTVSPAPPPAPPLLAQYWRFQDLAIIGQLDNTYILAQCPEGLILIDQHAAHERVLYETLGDTGGRLPRQPLLFPRVVEVKPAQAEWVRSHLAELAQAGLELEPFGGASFLVRTAPAALAHADLEAMLLEMVESLSPEKSEIEPEMIRERTRLIMACHGAIRAGQELSREKMGALLAQLDELVVSSHCPHGRPLWRLIPSAEIRQSFRRPRG